MVQLITPLVVCKYKLCFELLVPDILSHCNETTVKYPLYSVCNAGVGCAFMYGGTSMAMISSNINDDCHPAHVEKVTKSNGHTIYICNHYIFHEITHFFYYSYLEISDSDQWTSTELIPRPTSWGNS